MECLPVRKSLNKQSQKHWRASMAALALGLNPDEPFQIIGFFRALRFLHPNPGSLCSVYSAMVPYTMLQVKVM